MLLAPGGLARGAAALPVSGQSRRAAAKGLHRVNCLNPSVFILENTQGSAFPTGNPGRGREPGWVCPNLLPVPLGGEKEACWDPARPGTGMGLPLSDFTQPQRAVRATACGCPAPSQPAHAWLEEEPSGCRYLLVSDADVLKHCSKAGAERGVW